MHIDPTLRTVWLFGPGAGLDPVIQSRRYV